MSDEELAGVTQFLIARPPTWAVHLTGVGTRRWLKAAERLAGLELLLDRLRGARLVARGPKVRAALREYGLHPLWIPDDELSSTIAKWLAPQLGPQDVVVVQCAGESPPGFVTALSSTGALTVEISPYRWTIPADPTPAVRLARALAADEVDVLLVTSAPQVAHLVAVACDAGCEDELRATLTTRVYIGAVGTAAAAALRAVGFAVDVVARPARLGALVRTIAASRDAVVAKRG